MNNKIYKLWSKIFLYQARIMIEISSIAALSFFLVGVYKFDSSVLDIAIWSIIILFSFPIALSGYNTVFCMFCGWLSKEELEVEVRSLKSSSIFYKQLYLFLYNRTLRASKKINSNPAKFM